MSTAVWQAVACAPVTQRARVPSPVVTSFLGEVFLGFSSPVRQMSGSVRPPKSPNIIWPSLSSSIIITGASDLGCWRALKPQIYQYTWTIKINILNSCPTQGRVEGWDAMKPLHYRSVSRKGAGRPRLTHHHKGWWNETKWMRWVWRNDGMKFVVGENGRNPVRNLSRPRFVHHETHMEGPRRELGTPAVGGECLTACATRPPHYYAS